MRKKPIYHLLELLLAFSKRKQLIGAAIIMALVLVQSHNSFSSVVTAQAPRSDSASPLEQTAPSQALITVDHTSIALFDQIPDQYIQAAANLNMLFIDRSVGGNINEGLDCLAYESDEAAPSRCKRNHTDSRYVVDPATVLNWYHPGGYDRSNWDFLYWDNLPVSGCTDWSEKTDCFINYMQSGAINNYDVVSYQFSYLLVVDGSTIEDQPGGFFWDNPGLTDVYDQEALEAQYPNKTFIYWTTSLARSIGTNESEIFNQQTRQYANDHGKILFDVADILSHDPDGNPCYDNRDGVPYGSENHPDDGLNLLAICPHYTTEVEGGHLGSASAGMIRVAQGFWVLMAQIAGWDPGTTTPTLPRVQSISPANGATDVAVDAPLVINFSEAMNTGSVSYTVSPNPGGVTPSWNGSGTQLTLTHNDFSEGAGYTVTVTGGTDLDGNGLENVPFASSFRTEAPHADLSIGIQASDVFVSPGDWVTFTLTVANAGPVSPVSTTVVDQWSPAGGVSDITGLPANCQVNMGSGSFSMGVITCTNVELTAGVSPTQIEFSMQLAGTFTGTLSSQASVAADDATLVEDNPANNSALALVNPLQFFLPLIMR